jgi:hypothetical protein
MQPRVPEVGSIQKKKARKKIVQLCLEHSLHQKRKKAANKFIPSVSNMLRMGPRQPLDCHKTQDGKQIKQPRRWCCSCMNPEASQLCWGTCKISMRIPFSIVLTGSTAPKITPECITHGTWSEPCEARAFAANESFGMCDANGGGLSGVLTSGNFFVE